MLQRAGLFTGFGDGETVPNPPGPATQGAWTGLQIPAGAEKKSGLGAHEALGFAAFGIAMGKETIIRPGADANTFDVAGMKNGSFDVRGFSQSLRVDFDYWEQTINNALRAGKTVWIQGVGANDFYFRTLDPTAT